MDKFVIKGPSKIKGEVSISGSKNAALPILAATLLFDKPVTIQNLPRVRDINTMLNLLRTLGKQIILSKDKKSVKIVKKKKKFFCPYSIVKQMRGSFLVLGSLISKYNKAIISFPGGCVINGKSGRPIDYHLSALKKLGMEYTIKKGYIHAKSKGKLKGSIIKFSKISVGATENVIIAACLSQKKTIIKRAAIEPEIKDLINFLNSAGGKIKIIGQRSIQIDGVKELKSTKYKVMSDRIETGTFCIAACLNQGELNIKNFNPKLIQTELNLLRKIGAKIRTSKNEIYIKGPKKIKNLKNLETKPWPGLATDLQAQFMVLLCKAVGRSSITEKIFHSRFIHAQELNRMGAQIRIKENKAIIEGGTKFQGAEVISSDLRASVALVLAATVANSTTIVTRIYALDRGYEQLEKKLRKIGVNIKRLS